MNMKNWLRAGAALLACVFGLMAFYAFQKAEVKSETELEFLTWYYTGDPTERMDPAKYTLVDTNQSLCGYDNKEICSILAPNNGFDVPDFTAQVPGTDKTVGEQINLAIADPNALVTNTTVNSLRALIP